jgi:hypothetical protein
MSQWKGLTLKDKHKFNFKNLFIYLIPTYQCTYLPNYHTPIYLPTHWPTYLHTCLPKLNFYFYILKCHMTYFDYAKWQILITLSAKMWMGYILVAKKKISCKLHRMVNGWDHICWPYTSYIRDVLTSWWIILCN